MLIITKSWQIIPYINIFLVPIPKLVPKKSSKKCRPEEPLSFRHSPNRIYNFRFSCVKTYFEMMDSLHLPKWNPDFEES